jgi:hypothetical protein
MKATIATVKSFIKKNANDLFIDINYQFDGMIDGIRYCKDGFSKVEKTNSNTQNTFGIAGAWFVGSSRDYITSFENENLVGYHICNSCGSFTLATNKNIDFAELLLN